MFISKKKAELYSSPLCEITVLEAEASILDSSFVSGDLPTWGDDGSLDL